MKNHLLTATRLRYLCGLIGGVILPLVIYLTASSKSAGDNLNILLILSCTSFLFALIGEFAERFLFFAAEVSKKMPGGA